MHVDTGSGRWSVRRRWAPRQLGCDTIWARFRDRSRWVRRRTSDLADVPEAGCIADIAESIVFFVMVLAAVTFLVIIGVPFVIALGELLLVVLLGLGGLVGRVLFRRPWTVDAVAPDGQQHEWRVVGWRSSGAARSFIADRIAAGDGVPTDEELIAAVRAP